MSFFFLKSAGSISSADFIYLATSAFAIFLFLFSYPGPSTVSLPLNASPLPFSIWSLILEAKLATLSPAGVSVNILDAMSDNTLIILLSSPDLPSGSYFFSSGSALFNNILLLGSVINFTTSIPASAYGSGLSSSLNSVTSGSACGCSSSLIILLMIGNASSTLLSRFFIVNFSLNLFTVSSSNTTSSAVLKSLLAFS